MDRKGSSSSSSPSVKAMRDFYAPWITRDRHGRCIVKGGSAVKVSIPSAAAASSSRPTHGRGATPAGVSRSGFPLTMRTGRIGPRSPKEDEIGIVILSPATKRASLTSCFSFSGGQEDPIYTSSSPPPPLPQPHKGGSSRTEIFSSSISTTATEDSSSSEPAQSDEMLTPETTTVITTAATPPPQISLTTTIAATPTSMGSEAHIVMTVSIRPPLGHGATTMTTVTANIATPAPSAGPPPPSPRLPTHLPHNPRQGPGAQKNDEGHDNGT
ncbi:hypothetical protein PG984_013856 [Apiospora sp. TS-2023a]